MGLLSYIQSLEQRSQTRLQIWKFDRHLNFVKFGNRTKQMMCSIAHHFQELHTSFQYLSNLLNRVFIQLSHFSVSFPYEAISTVLFNDPIAQLTVGIADDTYQFRLMVSLLLKSTPELINLSQPYWNNLLRFEYTR